MDVFPNTTRTWIDDALDRGAGGRQEVNHHVMTTYAWPLRVYFLGTNSRWLGDPDEIVAAFFADRLARPDFLASWQASGKPLRRWLMNGLCFYLRELTRQRRRESGLDIDPSDAVTFDGDPNHAIDSAATVSFVRERLRRDQAVCRARGLIDHLDTMLRHRLGGESFRQIATLHSIDEERAHVMARTAERHFRRAMRDVLCRDGVAPEDVDDEIRLMLESMP